MAYMIMIVLWLALKVEPSLMSFAMVMTLFVIYQGIFAMIVEMIHDQVSTLY